MKAPKRVKLGPPKQSRQSRHKHLYSAVSKGASRPESLTAGSLVTEFIGTHLRNILLAIIVLDAIMLVWGIVVVSVPSWHTNSGCGARAWELDVTWVIVEALVMIWAGLKFYEIIQLANSYKSMTLPATVQDIQNMPLPIGLSASHIVEIVLILLITIPWVWSFVLLLPGAARPYSCIDNYASIIVIYYTTVFLSLYVFCFSLALGFCVFLSSVGKT